MSLTHKSQSALEYMMTYGWAILIIVIVAGVLYSFGIFNPSSSASTTITGFSGLGSVQAECLAGQGLEISLGNSIGYTIYISKINYTTDRLVSSINESVNIPAGSSNTFFIPNVCPTAAGSRYSVQLTVTYSEPGQVFGGTSFSSGTASGATSLSGNKVQINITSSAQTAAPFQQAISFPSSNYAGYSQIVGDGVSTANAFFTYPNGTVIPSWIESTSPGAPNFTASDTYLRVNNSFVYHNFQIHNKMTVLAWIYQFPPPVGSTMRPFGTWSQTGNPGWLILTNFNSCGSYRYQFLIVGTFTPCFSLPNLTWSQVAISWNGAVMSLYVNGNFISNTSNTGVLSTANQGFWVGNEPDVSGQTFYGQVSNVQIYNSSLSTSQIRTLYLGSLSATPITGANLVAWYPLNDSVKDYSTYGDTLTNTNTNFLPNATIWLKFNGGLPSGKTIIYMNFLQPSDNALNTQNIGEAPQLSSTYGQYDNGADVFLAYFNGLTPPSQFNYYNTYISLSNSISFPVNTVNVTRSCSSCAVLIPEFILNTPIPNIPLYIESNTYLAATSTADNPRVALVNTTQLSGKVNAIGVNVGWGGVYFQQEYISSGSYTSNQNPQGSETVGWVYSGLQYTPSSSTFYGYTSPQLYSTNGGYSGSATNTLSPTGEVYIGGIGSPNYIYSITQNAMFFNWMRARAYPPAGVMPSVSFGAVQ